MDKNMPLWEINFDYKFNSNDPEIIRLLERARALSGVIREIPLPPRLQEDFDSLNVVRAVRGTTGIEGLELEEDEVKKIIEASSKAPMLGDARSREENEVLNANKLMEYVKGILTKNPHTPLNEALIKRFHYILTRNIEYKTNVPAEYREHAVSAGDYVPPRTYDEISKNMRDFIEWFNGEKTREWDNIALAIIAHFYVVSIHPFGDGNGRTSRGVESFLLYRAGVNVRSFYSLANFYYSRRSDYIEYLSYVRFSGQNNLTPFVKFALSGLVEELTSLHTEVILAVKAITFREYVREHFSNMGQLYKSIGKRRFEFLIDLVPYREGIALDDLKNGNHRLSRFYSTVSTKTLDRDIEYFIANNLIVVENDLIKANLSLLDRFTAGS